MHEEIMTRKRCPHYWSLAVGTTAHSLCYYPEKTLEEQSSYQWIKTPWHSCDNRGNWQVTSHYLNQCWNIVNWTLGKKLQLNLNRCWYILIEKCIWRMAAIVSRPLCVNHNECGLHIANISFNIVRHMSFPQCDTTVMQWCWEWFYYHCCVTILLIMEQLIIDLCQ